MLQFDAETSRVLEMAYQGADVTRRRRGSFDALAPLPGETVADLGCGNGLLTLELARAVGDGGRVIGIDPSSDMRDLAKRRCKDQSNVEIVEGVLGHLPMPTQTIDKALSLQVFEYLDDIPAALAEVARVLKPDGRLVIADTHWDTLTWSSDHPSRMARMLKAWESHLAEPRVPAMLPHVLRESGYAVERVEPLTFCDTVLKPDGLAQMLIILASAFALRNGLLGETEVQDWRSEQDALSLQGRFFFSLTHVVVTARRL